MCKVSFLYTRNMHKYVLMIRGEEITFWLRRRKRMKSITITIQYDGRVVVSTSRYAPLHLIYSFVQSHYVWIKRNISSVKTRSEFNIFLQYRDDVYRRYKESARTLVHDKLSYFSQIYNVKYNKVSIKNTRSLWGSCSRKGNLNFNYKIIFLPVHLQEYIIVHELCHLKEFNHSKCFWDLVLQVIPDYKERRKELVQYIQEGNVCYTT